MMGGIAAVLSQAVVVNVSTREIKTAEDGSRESMRPDGATLELEDAVSLLVRRAVENPAATLDEFRVERLDFGQARDKATNVGERRRRVESLPASDKFRSHCSPVGNSASVSPALARAGCTCVD